MCDCVWWCLRKNQKTFGCCLRARNCNASATIDRMAALIGYERRQLLWKVTGVYEPLKSSQSSERKENDELQPKSFFQALHPPPNGCPAKRVGLSIALVQRGV